MSRPHIVLDLDGTLTIDDKTRPYPEREPWAEVHAAAHAAREAGYGLLVLTARGMRTWKGVREDVEAHVRPGVERWLDQHALAPDATHVAKPWCGPGGFYVDDRNLHIEEFLWRFEGPLASTPVGIRLLGTPPDTLRTAWPMLARLERWLHVVDWAFDDADPSTLGHSLPGDLDDRVPQRVLVTRLDRGRPDAAGWFAAHHPLLHDDRPFVVPDTPHRAGFAMVPPELVDAACLDPDTLPPEVVRRGWDGEEVG